MFLRKKKGFTLIELLVVIAIIGILATIVLVSLNSARVKARNARRQSDIHQISLAMEMCYDDTACAGGQAYPVIAGPGKPAAGIGVYMTSPPDDPLGAASGYNWVSAAASYCVYATLEGAGAGFFYASQKGTGARAVAGCP